jgi:hypothetical protein
MNEGGNNFSLIRNSEINRLGPKYIIPQFYEMYKIDEKMKELDAYEDEKYKHLYSNIWTRKDYTHKYCNKVIQYDYDKQYCILGLDTFNKNLSNIKELYKNIRNDFILFQSNDTIENISNILDPIYHQEQESTTNSGLLLSSFYNSISILLQQKRKRSSYCRKN